MSVNLSWKANEDADDVVSYLVERSIVGVESTNSAPFSISVGATVQLRIDGGNLLTIALSAITGGAATASEVATILDGSLAPYGGSAKVSSSGTKVIIQSNRQTDRGSVNIKGGTALAGLGILTGNRKFQEEFEEIATVSHPSSSFEDLDGETGYQYRIRAENSTSQVSDPTEWFEGFRETIPTAVIYGHLVSPDGKPLEGALVEYGPPIDKRPSNDVLAGWIPNSGDRVGVGIQFMEVYTNEIGYFQLVVPAKVPMRLKIDSVGHDFVYETPVAGEQKDFVTLAEAVAYQSYALNSDWNNV